MDMEQNRNTDYEIQMAKEQLYNTAKWAIELFKLLEHVSETEGLEAWVQAKITKASDYMDTVYHYMQYELMDPSDEQHEEVGVEESSALESYKNSLTERMTASRKALGELSPDTLYKYHSKAWNDEADRRGSGDTSDENKRKIANRKQGRSLAAQKHNKAKGWERPKGAKKDASDASKSAAALAKHLAKQDRKTAKAEESLEEKAKSKAQQKFMGTVHAMQQGEKVKGASKEMKTYRVVGEYGPIADMSIEFEVRASSYEDAREQAIQLLKKSDYWDRIGERNVYVNEIV